MKYGDGSVEIKSICDFYKKKKIKNRIIQSALLDLLDAESFFHNLPKGGLEDRNAHFEEASELFRKIILRVEEKDFHKNLKSREEEAIYNLLLGYLYYRISTPHNPRYLIAIRYVQKVIETWPQEKMLHHLLAGLYWDYAQERYYDTKNGHPADNEKFRELCLKAVKEYGQVFGVSTDAICDVAGMSSVSMEVHLHDMRGMILEILGRYKEAKAEYKKAVKIDPGFHRGWYMLRKISQAMGGKNKDLFIKKQEVK